MIAITYAPDLVEEAVLLAERTLTACEARTFRRERDRLYGLPTPIGARPLSARFTCVGSRGWAFTMSSSGS